MNKSNLLLSVILLSSLFMGLGNSVSNTQATGITPLALTNSTISATETLVLPRTEVSVTVNVVNESGVIENADVVFQTPEGVFNDTSTTTTTIQSDINGDAVVTWIAPDLPFSNPSLLVTIQAEIQFGLENYTLYQNIEVSHFNTSLIQNSKIIVPAVVSSNETVQISTQVLDGNNIPTPDIQVTLNELTQVSNFTTTAEGFSDNNGFFNATWQAPELTTEFPEKNVIISAQITAGPNATLTIEQNFVVRLLNVTALTITLLDKPNVVFAGDVVDIVMTVMAGSSPAINATVDLTVGGGAFANGNSLIQLIVNDTGYVSTNWTAPTVITNSTFNFAANAILLSIEGNLAFSINVNITVGSFKVIWDIPRAKIKQNESMVITVTVQDAKTSLPLVGISVTFGLDLGFWDNSGDATYSTTTDASGIATAKYNGSKTVPFKQEQEVNVTLTVIKEFFVTLETSNTFILEKLPDTYNFTYSVDNTEITIGDGITITLLAFQNNIPWADATFRLTANGGDFGSGGNSIANKTDANGKLIIKWSSENIPDIKSTLPIFIVIELVNSNLETVTVQINVNPISTSATSQTTEGGLLNVNNDNTKTIAAIVGGALVLGAIAVVVKKKT